MDQEDIQIIRSMPISKSLKPDHLVWHTKSGRYSVKSGYKVAQDMKAEVIVGPNCNVLMAQAWYLPVPPKIKHFFWQIVSASLPVMVRLASRGVHCDTVCKRCEIAEESINHTFFECPRSTQVWERVFDGLHRDKFPLGSIYSNQDFIYGKGLGPMALGVTHSPLPWLVWFIWKDRNNKVFQGLQSEPIDIINQALREQLWWEEAQMAARSVSSVSEPVKIPETTVRCQVDGSWKSTEQNSGLGWWCGDGENQTFFLGARYQHRSVSPLHSEMEALLWAMECILSRGIVCQRFETDSAELISMVQDPEEWPAFSALLDEFQVLSASFPHFTLSKIPRTVNVKADCLAHSSRTNKERIEDLEANVTELREDIQKLNKDMNNRFQILEDSLNRLADTLTTGREGDNSATRSTLRTRDKQQLLAQGDNVNQNAPARTVKLDFPRFKGGDPNAWLSKTK
ncbi:PREDICTED: uncharacterized protein LOC104734079 [Camelina sativa]|uniref:Uncharacterized protein LOC104734079 n=1 Tax=Camelina sativa TaxID=90675 RepID=A0ABM0V6Y2_CAMSA|nr:PREDICTED: uncharacterized protein LOC104734079 [Camelina sativa]